MSPTQIIYGGVFFGAEQIKLGDAVRVQSPDGSDSSESVMLVKSIYTHENDINFVGNVYHLKQASAAGPALPPPGEQPTGPVFAEEADTRSKLAVSRGLPPWSWLLVEKDAVRRERDVFGKSYVTARLMAGHHPDGFKALADRGLVADVGTNLNKRLQDNLSHYIGRKPTRQVAIGAAINSTLSLGAGIREEVAA